MLTPIAPALFSVDTHFRVPGGGDLPLRMTVLQLADGSVVLHSPIRIDDALAAELEAVGPISHLIAPNCFHHVFAGKAKERWPNAKLLGAPGLAEKRPDLAFDGELGDSLLAPLAAELDACVVGGSPRMGEVVFFHRATRTLLATDLVFNLDNPPGLALRLALSMMGNRRGLKQSRLLRVFNKDRAALQASVERIINFPAERVIMGHGAILAGGDVVARLRAACWWSLGEKKPGA